MTPEFERMLNWGGSPQAQCQCGRTHFTLSGDFMDEGELAALMIKAKSEPDSYIGDPDNDSVSIATWNGVPLVWGCPCGALDKIESRVWNNRIEFTKYFRKRAEREAKEAMDTLANIQPATTTVPKL